MSVLLNTTVPTAPDAPTILRNATAGNQSATMSWTAPAYDGGSPIIGYIVTAYVGYAPVKVRIFKSPLTTQTVTGLTNGTEYRFRVRAWNAVGISGYSKVTNPVTPSEVGVASFSGPGISAPIGIALGSDGALWFTNYDNASIGRITPDGAVTNTRAPATAL